jgi:hypothetical protein
MIFIIPSLASIYNQLFDPCLVTDKQGLVVYFNPTAQEVFGSTIRNCLGKNLFELIKFQTSPIENKIVEGLITLDSQDLGPFQIKKFANDDLITYLLRDTSFEINIHKKYKERTQALIQLNQEQERIIEQRTSNLSFANKLLENVVSLSRQTIFNFDHKGNLIEAFPKSTKEWQLYEILEGHFTKQQTAEWISHLQQKTIALQDLLGLTPDKIILNGIEYSTSFHFSEMPKADSIIVVILKDLTNENFLINQTNIKNQLINSIYKASIHHGFYLDAIKETNSIFRSIEIATDQEEIKKLLHALRGTLSCFGPEGIEEKIMTIEKRRPFQLGEHEIETIGEDYNKKIEILLNHLPFLKRETVLVPKQMLKDVAEGREHFKILGQYHQLDLKNIILSFENYIRELSDTHHVEVDIKINIENQNLFLDHQFNACISQFLIHGIRNSFAHILRQGLENSISLSLSLKDDIILCIESEGLVEKPNTEFQLSGQGQGLKLVDDLAKMNSSRTELIISQDKKKSFYSLYIPVIKALS